MTINMQPEDSAVFDRLKSNGRITHDLRRLITQQWNTCISCSNHVSKGRPAFAGYDKNSDPIFVGACCADQLQELASPVYWSESLNLSVPSDQTVWRYMDFAKFIAMLKENSIYLPRADTLDDPFEGATGLAGRQTIWDEQYLDFFRKIIVTPPEGYPVPNYSNEQLESEAQRLLRSVKTSVSKARQLLVSCWHCNDDESEALWRLYSPPPISGIAIKSTVEKLWDACSDHETAIVGRVQYIDFRRSFASTQNERIFQKRRSLSHEMEVRMVLQNDRQTPADGKMLNCDLEQLISRVVVSPFAPPWFFDVVSEVIERFEYSFELKRSELLDQPFY